MNATKHGPSSGCSMPRMGGPWANDLFQFQPPKYIPDQNQTNNPTQQPIPDPIGNVFIRFLFMHLQRCLTDLFIIQDIGEAR